MLHAGHWVKNDTGCIVSFFVEYLLWGGGAAGVVGDVEQTMFSE